MHQQARARALVLHSGGLDSTVCLALAIRDFGKENVISVGMNYGQLHRETEFRAAETICSQLGVRRIVHNIEGAIPPAGLADPNFKVPDVSYAEITGVSPTYVPFRNGTMLALLAGLVTAFGNPDKETFLYFGAHAEDAENWAYPDCTPEFIGAMATAIYVGTYGKARLKAPLAHLQKAEVVTMGMETLLQLNMYFDDAAKLLSKSVSCYKGKEMHCGTCPTCISRKAAFVLAAVTDHTVYQDRVIAAGGK